MTIRVRLLLLVCVGLAMSVGMQAQGRGGAGAPGGAVSPARVVAPKDLTGYWVSVVAEHWHLRMLVPPRGEFAMLPLNAEARRIANTWDPAKEPAAEQCRSYGAAAIMRVPSRLNVHWADDNTLQMDIDSGTQTRVFHFGGGAAPANQPPQWQGYSVAEWEGVPAQELRARKAGAPPDPRGGLKVTTTRMRAAYLRKNGVPYSENATLVEYFDRFTEPNGDDWIVVDSIVTDPQYLTQPYLTSSAFKKIPDRSGWDPTPCRADQAR
ncbi:MAG: hypothetical protein ACRD3C_10000 [Vicinamibacterales bacterium]